MKNNLKKLRKEKKIKQKDLALMLNIPLRTLQRWENEESSIKPDKLKMLAEYFGVTPEYLLGYSDIRTNEDKKHLEGLLNYSDGAYLVDDMPDDEFDYRKAVYETKLAHLKVLEKKDAEKARLIDEMLILAENELSIDELRMFVDQMGGYLLKKRRK